MHPEENTAPAANAASSELRKGLEHMTDDEKMLWYLKY